MDHPRTDPAPSQNVKEGLKTMRFAKAIVVNDEN